MNINPGAHKDIPMVDYLKCEAIGASGLWSLLTSGPHKFQQYRNKMRHTEHLPQPTTVSRNGTLLHAMMLEGPRAARNLVATTPDCQKRSASDKAIWKQFEKAHADKIWIKDGELEDLFDVGQRHTSNPLWEVLVSDHKGVPEQTIVQALGDYTKVHVKCRPDWTPEAGDRIIDLKTSTVPLNQWARDVSKYGLHVSAALYLDVCSAVLGRQFREYVFVVAEQSGPEPEMVAFRASDAMVEAGRRDYQAALKLYAKCVESDLWPAFGERMNDDCCISEVQELDLPGWFTTRDGTPYRDLLQ